MEISVSGKFPPGKTGRLFPALLIALQFEKIKREALLAERSGMSIDLTRPRYLSPRGYCCRGRYLDLTKTEPGLATAQQQLPVTVTATYRQSRRH